MPEGEIYGPHARRETSATETEKSKRGDALNISQLGK